MRIAVLIVPLVSLLGDVSHAFHATMEERYEALLDVARVYSSELSYSEQAVKAIDSRGGCMWTWDGTFTLLRSCDQGVTWEARPVPPERGAGISFLDGNVGFLAGRQGIWSTKNGGLDWKCTPLPGWDEPGKIAVNHDGSGLAAVSDSIWHTENFGESWKKLSLLVDDETRNYNTRVFLQTEATTWILARSFNMNNTGDENILYRIHNLLDSSSRDAIELGEKTISRGSILGREEALFALGKSLLWVVTGKEPIHVSLPDVKEIPKFSIASLALHDKGEAYMLCTIHGGDGAALFSTRDYGASWTLVSRWDSLDLFVVHVDPHGNVFLGGDSGVILKSEDHGASWKMMRNGLGLGDDPEPVSYDPFSDDPFEVRKPFIKWRPEN